MFKKMFLFVLCAFFSFSIFGCSSITLQTVQGKNGNISSSLTIDATELSTQEKQITYDFVREYCEQLVSAYKTNMIELFSNIYDFETLGLINEDDKLTHIILYNNNYNLLAGDVDFSVPKEDFVSGNSLTVSIGFVSIYSYMMFFCPNAYYYDNVSNTVKFDSTTYSMLIDVPVISNDYNIEESAFMTTHIQTCVPFSYNGSEPVLLQDYTTATKTYQAGTTLVSAICEELEVSEDEARFVFNFVTPFSRLHSNSNLLVENSGYHHIWALGSDINAEVTLWRNYSNYTLWYIISLSAGILVLAVGFLVIAIIKNTKKKNGMDNLKKIDEFINNKG